MTFNRASNNVAAITYDNGTLEVTYTRNSKTARYYDVPVQTWTAIINSASVGSSLHRLVTSQAYRWEYVTKTDNNLTGE